MKRAAWFRTIASAAALLSLACAAPRIAAAAPDDTLGVALMGAIVSGDGAFWDKAGATSVKWPAWGRYVIQFERPITGCFFSVTPMEERIVMSAVINNNKLEVHSTALDGTANNTWFHVLVYCPK